MKNKNKKCNTCNGKGRITVEIKEGKEKGKLTMAPCPQCNMKY